MNKDMSEISGQAQKILLLENYKQTLVAVRALAQSGYHVIVGRGPERTFTEFSRFTSESWEHPEILEKEEEFFHALLTFLQKRRDVKLIFPIGEFSLQVLALHAKEIPAGVTVLSPDPDIVSTCLNKPHIYRIVSQLNIPCAYTSTLESFEKLIHETVTQGFPCVIKPHSSMESVCGKKALILHSQKDLLKWKDDLEAQFYDGQRFLFQGFVQGERFNCHFAAIQGKMMAYFEQKVLRTDRIDGTGYGVDGISLKPLPFLYEKCQTLIAHLQYNGVGCIQFLVDSEKDEYSFLEINPRLDATCALPFWCGYDFPTFAVECGNNNNHAFIKNASYAVNKRGHWLLGDIQGFFHSMERGDLSREKALDWMRKIRESFWNTDCHLTWSWADPVPTCFLYAQSGLAILRRIKQRILPRKSEV